MLIRTTLSVGLFLLVTPAVFATLVPAASAQRFVDATHHLDGASDQFPRPVPSVSAVDVNSDGLIDFYRRRKLYVQNPDGSFGERSVRAGLIDSRGNVQGGLWADYDNDGFTDVLLPDQGGRTMLYKNIGQGSFATVNHSLRLEPSEAATGASWADFNLDGQLDLFIADRFGNHGYYRSRTGSRFGDQSSAVPELGNRRPCGISSPDVNRDGRPDVYLSACLGLGGSRSDVLMLSDSTPPLLRDESRLLSASSFRPSIGAVWADFDRDGNLDVYVANAVEEPPPDLQSAVNFLYFGTDEGRLDQAATVGDADGGALDQAWSVAAADFDNDGWVDLYVSNRDGSEGGAASASQHIYRNNGDRTFSDVTDTWLGSLDLPGQTGAAVSVALADVNNDGWIDIFLASREGDRLLLNTPDPGIHWAGVKLTGTDSNRDAMGAEITLRAGGRIYRSQIISVQGYNSQHNDFRAHFGLGDAEAAQSLTVRWPSGTETQIQNPPIDRLLHIVEGVGLNAPPETPRLIRPAPEARFNLTDSPITFRWSEPDDPGSDNLSFAFHVRGPGIDSVITDVSGNSLTFDADVLAQGQKYRWTVTAHQGAHIVASSDIRQFQFGGSTVAAPFKINMQIGFLHNAQMEFGDFDADGDLDLLTTGSTLGSPMSRVYEAVDSLFAEGDIGVPFKMLRNAGFELLEVENAIGTWVDLEGDGLLELFISGVFDDGIGRSARLQFYRHNGGTYAPFEVTGIEPVHFGAADFADIDSDGDADLLLSGARSAEAPFNPITAVYRQESSTRWTEIPLHLPGLFGGDVAFGDVNADGASDMVISGADAQGRFVTRYYTGDGSGGFTEQPVQLPGVSLGSVDLADFDSDGDDDLLLSGGKLSPGLFRGTVSVFRSDNGHLVPVGSSEDVSGVVMGEADWLDYDLDGDLDILATGAESATGRRISWIYRNEESSRFAEEFQLSGVIQGAVAAGDYNADGDVDIVLSGRNDENVSIVLFYLNLLRAERVPRGLIPR